MKTTMRTHRSADELKTAAESMAQTITIRYYTHGSSHDVPRPTTTRERKCLSSILWAALLAANSSEASRSDTDIEYAIVTMAEYNMLTLDKAILRLPESIDDPEIYCNTYMTIFCPLMDYIRAWRDASAK